VYIIYIASKPDTGGAARSQKKTQQYIKEKIILDNMHCSNLPTYDSRGLFSGTSGSFTDKTGKFSSAYQEDINNLNEKYGYRRPKDDST